MRIKQTNVYEFDELSERAKEKARGWWRESASTDDWVDYVRDDCVEVAKILGIEIEHQPGENMRGEAVVGNPKIYFSVYGLQGDGASFVGHYSYGRGWHKALTAHAPNDKDLFEIGSALQEAQRSAFWDASACISQSGRYNHSGFMSIDVDCGWNGTNESVVSAIEWAMRAFADWMYSQLKSEYEYIMSDEYVDDGIRGNSYEFYEDGKPARE